MPSLRPSVVPPAVTRAAAALAALSGATVADSTVPAAPGRLEARYTLTLAGLPFGGGTWQVDVREDQFSAKVTGSVGGLAQLLTSGSASTAAQGSISRGHLWGTSYASTVMYGKRADEVRMS